MTTETEARDLERRLAYREALVSVESYCVPEGDGFFNLANHDLHVPDGELDEAVRYLEWRGLLERRENAPHVVRVKEDAK